MAVGARRLRRFTCIAWRTFGWARAIERRSDLKVALRGNFPDAHTAPENLADFAGGLRL